MTIGNPKDMIDNAHLCELLGISASEVEQWAPVKRNDAVIAVTESGNRFKFIPGNPGTPYRIPYE